MTLTPPILVLGMHRSGTSCLAGCLEEAGVFLGDVNVSAPFNQKGNRENRQIMELHDSVLARVNAKWDAPPLTDPVWTATEKKALTDIVTAYSDIPIWGVKDPRTLFMLDGWDIFDRKTFIGTFRHPNEVAASLVNRAKVWNQPMSLEQAYGLWAAYNRRMIQQYEQTPFDILRYDVSADHYQAALHKVCQTIGLTPAQPISFREESLHHYNSEVPVPDGLKVIWETLNEIAV